MEYSHLQISKLTIKLQLSKHIGPEIQINRRVLNRNKPRVYNQPILTMVPRKFIGEGTVCPTKGAGTAESERNNLLPSPYTI